MGLKFETAEYAQSCKSNLNGKRWPEPFSPAIKVDIINLEQANQ